MGDSGGDSGGYDYSHGGDGGGSTSISREEHLKNLSPSEKIIFLEQERKSQNFLLMGASSVLLALSVASVALPALGSNVQYTESGINFCSHSIHKKFVEGNASLLDRFANLYCEPVVNRYLSNEDNPHQVKDSQLNSDVANKITNLRSLYVPATKKSNTNTL